MVPDSHKTGLRSVHKNESVQEHVSWEVEYQMRDREGREWTERGYAFEIDDVDPVSIVMLTVPRGAGIFFTSLMIHGSFANRSAERPRRAFATHYVREDTWVYRTDIQNVVPAR